MFLMLPKKFNGCFEPKGEETGFSREAGKFWDVLGFFLAGLLTVLCWATIGISMFLTIGIFQ